VAGEYFFMVGLAEFTTGKNNVSGSVELLQNDSSLDENVFVDGRVAYYLKGKIKGKYLLTSQLDTGEGAISEIFKDLDRRDPSKLFKRIDPDRYYPVYGDGSTVSRDVDTQGKFYLRMDWDQSSLLWGNYNTGFSGTELGSFNRGLYGAKLDLRSADATVFDDEKSIFKVFVSEPDSGAAHDELEGSGGSLYYLSHQDLVLGSAKLSVEVREKDSDRVRERTELIEGRDFEIDEFQGRVILNRPLQTNANNNLLSIIRDQPLEGDRVILVADYEYVPSSEGVADRLTGGVRAKHWINDYVALGGTYLSEENGDVEFENKAVDLTLRAGQNTHLTIEYGKTKANQNVAFNTSIDGGLNFDDGNSTEAGAAGDAISINGIVDLAEITGDKLRGNLGAWYRDHDAQFNSVQYNNTSGEDRKNYGVEGSVDVTENLEINWRYSKDETDSEELEKTGVQAEYRLNDRLTLATELQHRERSRESDFDSADREQANADILGVKASWQVNRDLRSFLSAQHTLNASEVFEDDNNDQLGLGLDYRVNEKLSINGEVFSGDKGEGARMGTDYRLNQHANAYVNYTLENHLARNRNLTLGQRSQLTDKLSVYQEHRFDTSASGQGSNSDQQRANSYGLSYEFSEGWNLGFEMLNGTAERDGDSYDRNAYSVSSRWKRGDIELVNRMEYRDDTSASGDLNQWVTANRFTLRVNNDWSVLSKLDFSVTEETDEQSNDEYTAGKFAEFDLGVAYRPVLNNRLNLLGMYSYQYDLDPLQQFGSQALDERSHVMSLEGIYELSQRWELGGKLAWKRAEIRATRDSGDFFQTNTSLGIVRARYHFVKNWDTLIEFRTLAVDETEDRRSGYLVSLERHLGDNVKLGLGYNFTSFNDDLTALDYEAEGWFVNVLGKF
jgi:hypothetical protein